MVTTRLPTIPSWKFPNENHESNKYWPIIISLNSYVDKSN